MDRLSALSAESLSVPRATDAVAAIARVIRNELPVVTVQVVLVEGTAPGGGLTAWTPEGAGEALDPELVRLTPAEGRIVWVGPGGASHVARRGASLSNLLSDTETRVGVFVPLTVRERSLGVLHVGDPGGLHLDHAQAVFADTLSYYATLALERARLAAQAEHVEALREADRLKDALLASVSHDLRTPLTSIRALASELGETGDERAWSSRRSRSA